MDFWYTQEKTPRCICDDSIGDISSPCSQIQKDGFFGAVNAICHPNHCSSDPISEFMTIRLDVPYEEYSDTNLQESIAILNSWINDQSLAASRSVRVFRVD